jgi:hypothetical protein
VAGECAVVSRCRVAAAAGCVCGAWCVICVRKGGVSMYWCYCDGLLPVHWCVQVIWVTLVCICHESHLLSILLSKNHVLVFLFAWS